METKILGSIEAVPPDVWNAQVPRNALIRRHEYLRAVEASRISDCRYFYLVVYEDTEVIAQASVYFISTEVDTFALGAAKRFISAIRRVWKRFLVMRTIECGSPVGLGTTISFNDGKKSLPVLEQIVGATEGLARRLRAPVVVFRDFYQKELPDYECLRTLGYTLLPNLPEARLEIRWRSFDEYLASLRSKYRYKLLTQMKKFQTAGGTMEELDDFSEYTADLARLWRNAYDRAKEYKRELLHEDFFANIGRFLGGRVSVVLAKLGGRPVGFLLLLLDDDTLITLFSGLDYSRHRESGVYLNLFYEAIKIALSRRKREVDFGITTTEPKAELGARVVPLYMFMKHLNPAANWIVPRAFEAMTPRLSVQAKRVFKQGAQ